VTTAVLSNQAAISAVLSRIMVGAGIGAVPVEVVDGHSLEYGAEDSERVTPEPMVRLERLPIELKSVPGYRESARAGSEKLQASDFFKSWAVLQGDVNLVAEIDADRREAAIKHADTSFTSAILNQMLDTDSGRITALREYEKAAGEFEAEKSFISAFMVWERAATITHHREPEKYRAKHRGNAARALYNALPEPASELDPYSLMLARAIWYAYGSSEMIYRTLLLKSSRFNDNCRRPFDAGADRLRIAFSVLMGEIASRYTLTVLANTIASAASFFEEAGRHDVNTEKLMNLAVELREGA
jgi:hypothetical protein